MKWVGLVGLVLSAFSIFIHFLLARFTEMGISDYQSSVTIFSWRPIFETPHFPTNVYHKHLTQKDLNFFVWFFIYFFSANPFVLGSVHSLFKILDLNFRKITMCVFGFPRSFETILLESSFCPNAYFGNSQRKSKHTKKCCFHVIFLIRVLFRCSVC